MSTTVMRERISAASPLFKARIAGVLYLIIIVTMLFAEFFVRARLVVAGDAAATATNILTHEQLYRLGGVAILIALACDTVIPLIFYDLFKPIGKSLALLAAAFRLMPPAIMGANLLNHFAPLALLKGAHVSASNVAQLQAEALVPLKLYAQGFNIAMVFFGFHCLLLGYLIYRSAFLPRILGGLMAMAGLCYLTHSFAWLLSPEFAAQLFPYVMAPPFVAEVSLTLGLLVKGLNLQRWQEGAAATV